MRSSAYPLTPSPASSAMSHTETEGDVRLLAVPDTIPYGHSFAGESRPRRRSRSPSPSRISSSFSETPTVRSSTPTFSGGPYLQRPHSVHGLLTSPSVTSLRSTHHPLIPHRPYHSTEALTKYSFASSDASFPIHIVPPDGSEDGSSVTSADVAKPSHDIAPPPGSNDPESDELKSVTPYDVEDTKYSPPRLSSATQEERKVWDIDPFEVEFAHHLVPPEGWERYTCPEGNVYFHNKTRGVLTLADMNDQAQAAWIEKAIGIYEEKKSSCRLPPDTEVVLDYRLRGYYLCSMERQRIFWLEKVPAHLATRYEREAISKAHLGHRITSEFWTYAPLTTQRHETDEWINRRHVSTFPNTYTITKKVLNELKSTMAFGYVDMTSSQTSTFPYDAELLLPIIRLLQKVSVDEECDPCYTSIVARYFTMIYNERFLHYHGELYARVTRGDSVFEPEKEHRSLFFRFCSLIFFNLPKLYYKELHKVYVDKTVHYYVWRRFIGGLKDDWQSSITPTTMLLSADVGFLAIQSLDNLTSYARSLAQICCYVSALLSLFDYMSVEILTRRHRLHIFDTAEQGVRHIFSIAGYTLIYDNLRHNTYLEERIPSAWSGWLSISGKLHIHHVNGSSWADDIYHPSLPKGLFMWSMLTFLMALEFVFYHHSTTSTMVTLSVVALILVFLVMMLLLINLLADDNYATRLQAWFNSMAEKVVWRKQERTQESSDRDKAKLLNTMRIYFRPGRLTEVATPLHSPA
ncbi:hypothetical protein NM688_g1813 [Phlebia brevispora]|uniref:Uncharacterized protein n=1 Tax=Phlebia brevispora TaxID=194682 RepID=A0ACC1TA89_9APHY|nr:hypothetical protein NM688_g1813 [Phlebia brevispora]